MPSAKPDRAPLCPGQERFIAEASAAYADAKGEAAPVEQRELYASFSRRFRQPRPATVAVSEAVATAGLVEVPLRFYRPAGRTDGERLPCILYMHGGGWVVGSVDTHDCITAELAESTGALVVSVDYRLAPEYPFPHGLNDCWSALTMLAREADRFGIDSSRMAVAGDSAGANLAAALALLARDRGGPALVAQALVYPVLGTSLTLPSYRENSDAPMLRTSEMKLYWQHYLGADGISENPYAAPLAARDLSGLPPATILTAGHDPVRDDGAHYAERLAAAGVTAHYRCAPDLAHGYLRARRMSRSAEAEFEALCAALKELLAAPAGPR